MYPLHLNLKECRISSALEWFRNKEIIINERVIESTYLQLIFLPKYLFISVKYIFC